MAIKKLFVSKIPDQCELDFESLIFDVFQIASEGSSRKYDSLSSQIDISLEKLGFQTSDALHSKVVQLHQVISF